MNFTRLATRFLLAASLSVAAMSAAYAQDADDVNTTADNASIQTPETQTAGFDGPKTDLDYANNFYLAHVSATSHVVNTNAKRGLFQLSSFMSEKSSIEAKGVASIDIEHDEIAFFPFIYWPITNESPALSIAAQRKVQNYINSGGVILFDIQDDAAQRNQSLRRVLGNVNIKALERVDSDHTLSRTFYIISAMHGEEPNDAIWVEQEDLDDPESVSSIIISQGNWAKTWAGYTYPVESDEWEDAMRTGMNMVAYSMTGNYKKDLKHNDAVLEKIELSKK